MTLAFGLALTALGLADTAVYRGSRGELDVDLPRIEAQARVDGALDDPVWSRAARLSGFTQFSPVDGLPAEQPTEVLVWYSPTALYFGVRAGAAPGSVRAHLGDRDRGIIPDDYIEIQIGTFNDGRQVFVFGANPLGIQADGTLIEGNARATTSNAERPVREQADLSPDFVWDSKGRVTEAGYEIEIRIPFRSLRYQRQDPQTWTLQIIRKSAASGREDTWAPARRAAASFVAQAGRLRGLTKLRRGLVLELNPVVTSTVEGTRPAEGEPWRYTGGAPEVGGNLRWGVSNDATLNGTVEPDFSQVEADASQITADPRSALYYQEKRPFFLDGIEYFSTPLETIYTRRIVAPIAAVKVTGRSLGTNFGLLSAVDDRGFSANDHNPIYNLVRIQRDLGAQSRIGLAYTDRVEGGDYNRVGQVDSRLLFGGIYNLSASAALSRTRTAGVVTTAPAWSLGFARTGRTLGVQSSFRGIDPDFQARSGFISRGDIAQVQVSPSLTWYGKRGAFLERFTATVTGDWLWAYDDLFAGRESLERKYHFSATWALRGGWVIRTSLLAESFSYDPRLYADYAIARPGPGGVDTIPYNDLGLPALSNLDYLVNVSSPLVHGFQLSGFMIYGRDENFFEWAPANIWYGNLTLGFRPTDQLRVDGSLALRSYRRRTDGTLAGDTYIPRLKTEYQVTRAIFLRLVGEYNADRRDDLRDDGRSNAPLLIRDAAGVYQRALATRTNAFRVDWLFSYQPSPGTVFFLGYGSSLSEDQAFRFSGLRRSSDGFFTKLSYLFRL